MTSGGNALKFYASVRLEVRRKMTHENSKGESSGIRVKAKVCITCVHLNLSCLHHQIFVVLHGIWTCACEKLNMVLMSQVVKNKVAPPYKIAEFDIMFGSGISGLGCLLDAAEAVGIVSKKGSWYYYGEEKLAQGRDKTLTELTEKPDIAECGLCHHCSQSLLANL